MTHEITAEAGTWSALYAHGERLKSTTMRELFAGDADRATKYTLDAAGLTLDYSKNRLDDSARASLFALARASAVEARRDAMFAGARINITENRSVLHTALRDLTSEQLIVDGSDILGPIRSVRRRTRTAYLTSIPSPSSLRWKWETASAFRCVPIRS